MKVEKLDMVLKYVSSSLSTQDNFLLGLKWEYGDAPSWAVGGHGWLRLRAVDVVSPPESGELVLISVRHQLHPRKVQIIQLDGYPRWDVLLPARSMTTGNPLTAGEWGFRCPRQVPTALSLVVSENVSMMCERRVVSPAVMVIIFGVGHAVEDRNPGGTLGVAPDESICGACRHKFHPQQSAGHRGKQVC